MNGDKHLSPAAKHAKSMVAGDRSGKYQGIRYAALAFLAAGILILAMELTAGITSSLSLAIVCIFTSAALLQRSGFMELVHKEYKNSE